MANGVEELASRLNSSAERPSGLKAVMERLALPWVFMKSHSNQIAAPQTSYSANEVKIDQMTYSHFLYHGYGRVASFVLFSNEARERTPKLDKKLRKLLNGKRSNPINMQLRYGKIHINAELTPYQGTYELRVINTL